MLLAQKKIALVKRQRVSTHIYVQFLETTKEWERLAWRANFLGMKNLQIINLLKSSPTIELD